MDSGSDSESQHTAAVSVAEGGRDHPRPDLAHGAALDGLPQPDAPGAGATTTTELLTYYRRRLDEVEMEQAEMLRRLKEIEVRAGCAAAALLGLLG